MLNWECVILILVIYGLFRLVYWIPEDGNYGKDRNFDFHDSSNAGKRTQKNSEYSEQHLSSIANRAWDAKKSETARKHLDELESIKTLAVYSNQSQRTINNIQFHINDVTEQVDFLAESEFEEKFSKVMDKFIYFLDQATTSADEGIKCDIEKMRRSKTNCLKYWHQLWEIPIDTEKQKIYPKKMMREYLENRYYYENFMDSAEGIAKKIDEAIAAAKPESNRKKKMIAEIMAYVKDQEAVMRTDLYRKCCSDATEKEVLYCVKELVEKNRLYQEKIGNRYFVYLSDKEKEKQNKKPPQ